MAEDHIYSIPFERVGDFTFDEEVVSVFPDMIARSVPGYASVLSMTAELAERYASPGSNIYDLGCSLGAATFLIRERVPMDCTIQAVDSSPAMVDRLQQLLAGQRQVGCRIEVCTADIREIVLNNASFVILNFTLQFIPLAGRPVLLQQVFDGLNTVVRLLNSERTEYRVIVHYSQDPDEKSLVDLVIPVASDPVTSPVINDGTSIILDQFEQTFTIH